MLYLASYEISALVTEFFNSGGGYGVLSLSHLTSYAISKNNIGAGIFEQLGGTVVFCLFYTEPHMRFLKIVLVTEFLNSWGWWCFATFHLTSYEISKNSMELREMFEQLGVWCFATFHD